MLQSFSLLSGLHVNMEKSFQIFAGITTQIRDSLVGIIGFILGHLPMRYLGVPLISGKLSYQDYVAIIDRMKKWIASWKTCPLSYAEQLVLIKVVLQSCYIYWAKIFGIPRKIMRQVESIMDHFLWAGPDLTRKMHPICWDAICKPLEEGGLNIRKVKEMNEACILKHL